MNFWFTLVSQLLQPEREDGARRLKGSKQPSWKYLLNTCWGKSSHFLFSLSGPKCPGSPLSQEAGTSACRSIPTLPPTLSPPSPPPPPEGAEGGDRQHHRRRGNASLCLQKSRSKTFNLRRTASARSPRAPSHFLGNDMRGKSKWFLADERAGAALQPPSHDRHPIKGNLYLTRLQKALHNAGRRFILHHNKTARNQTEEALHLTERRASACCDSHTQRGTRAD